MTSKQLIYIHGGEAFDSSWEGFSSVVQKNLKSLFKHGTSRWPDTLHRELEGFEVIKLKMPSKYNAKYKDWKKYFEAQLADFNDEVVLLGWSLGANFLAKYLSENQLPQTIKALHLVAGCYGCPGGYGIHKKLEGVSQQCDAIHIYHSKDDFVVDFADAEKYRQQLPMASFHVFENRNHFLQPEFKELMQQIVT